LAGYTAIPLSVIDRSVLFAAPRSIWSSGR